MKYIDTKDDLENQLFYRKVSEDGKIEIGIYPVLYGYRIRAGLVGDGFCLIDYCCGNEMFWITLVYGFVLTALENDVDFELFPFQHKKPMFNDIECWDKIQDLVKDLPVTKHIMSFPDLGKKKSKLFKEYFNL